MGKIKPTRVVAPRIVQKGDGGGRKWVWLLVLAVLAIWSWEVFEFGRESAGFNVERRDRSQDRLLERIAELEAERDRLQASAKEFERSGAAEQASVQEAQAKVKALQDERAELKREVAFLKSLESGEESKLVLGDYRLIPLDATNYRLEVTLSKRTGDQLTVNGQITVSLTGKIDGIVKKLDMQELTLGRRSNVGIRFKSFQKLKAELALPDGFEPSSIEIAFKPNGQDYKAFERTYDWDISNDA